MSIQSNIGKYYAFQLFNTFEFFMPVIVLFWQSKGLNFTQIMWLQSIYAIGVIVLELPTGALADYLGKRISLILGALFFTLGFVVYGLGDIFWHFVIGELVIGVGSALISGADSAFIHETLKSLGRGGEYKQVEGKVRGLSNLGRALGKLVGGFIGSFSLSLTLLATGVSTFLAFVTSLTFKPTQVEVERKEQTAYLQIIHQSLGIVMKQKKVLWLVLFFASFNALVWTTNWFGQPYLQMLNIPVAYFGIIFASFSVLSAVASSQIEHLESVLKRPFVAMSLLSIISLYLLGAFPSVYLIPLWAVFTIFIVVNQTLVSHKVLALVPEERAATVLSFMNLIRRFIYAGFGPVLGFVGDKYGLLNALQFNALILLVVLAGMYAMKKKWIQ